MLRTRALAGWRVRITSRAAWHGRCLLSCAAAGFRIANLQVWYYVSGMTTISLKIPDDLVARMDAVARATRTNRSALLRAALEEKLKSAARKTPPSLYERSADLCGKGSSGIGDLASNSKYLEGFGS